MRIIVLTAVAVLVAPVVAFAQSEPAAAGNGLELKVWALAAGLIVPLGGYMLNYLGPQASERVKAVVQVVLAAVAGAIVELVDLGSIGFDLQTLEYALTAVIAALGAHGLLWRPSTISTALGGGRNYSDRP